MEETSKLLLDILKQNEPETSNYFDRVLLSNEKTEIKFGSIDNEEISLNFFIHGQINKNMQGLENKIKALFNTNSDIGIINKILKGINTPKKVLYSPFLKISKEDEPVLHSFMVTIRY